MTETVALTPRRVGHQMRRADNTLNALRDRVASSGGVGPTIRELCRDTRMTAKAVQQALDDLEQRGDIVCPRVAGQRASRRFRLRDRASGRLGRETLRPAERRVLDLLAAKTVWPTQAEVAEHLHHRSRSTAHLLVRQLRRMGYVEDAP